MARGGGLKVARRGKGDARALGGASESERSEAVERFRRVLDDQLERVEALGRAQEWLDLGQVRPVVVGVVGGDGIGPVICAEARRVMESLLASEVRAGAVEVRTIEGLTLEDRLREGTAIPTGVVSELQGCHAILKGPTTTPRAGDAVANIESANVAMRRLLDLFANVRPVRVPGEGIDWTFFRENTEGAYLLGSQGFAVGPDLAIDLTVATRQGSRRVLELAFDFARRRGLGRLTVVTKSNVIKTTDGLFLEQARQVAKRYPEVSWDDWYVDAMAAKLLDPHRRGDFKVIVLPNLYGDILTDEAAQLQGGVGTAGSANIGTRHAMFEAIHGSAPRMVEEGRAEYADPQSMLRAVVMLLDHIGRTERARALERALDLCGIYERRLKVTGRHGGATASEFADYVLDTLKQPDAERRWQGYQAPVGRD